MSTNEHADVLSAMLRIAENEIQGKDEQIALLHQMVATNEDEIRKKDDHVDELQRRCGELQAEMDQYKALFNRYLAKAEAARRTSAFNRALNEADEAGAGARDPADRAGLLPSALLPPPTAAALLKHDFPATSPTASPSLTGPLAPTAAAHSPLPPSLGAVDSILGPPPSQEAPLSPPTSSVASDRGSEVSALSAMHE